MAEEFHESEEGWWHYITLKSNVPEKDTTGKYLFFSKDKAALISIAKKIMRKHKLIYSKVSIEAKGENHVLCIFDASPKLKHILRYENWADEENIFYRYWKSDEDAIKGVYSEKFLESGGYDC